MQSKEKGLLRKKSDTNLLKSTKSGRHNSLAGIEMLVKLLKSSGFHVN
jgi:hypothetical protein